MNNQALVLIIEDEKAIRNFICATLATQGYQYREADKGKEGIALFMSYNPDVIILDLGLPDMDGLEVLKEIRKWSSVPVLIVSARDQEREKVHALDLGADDYLTKPFGVAELLARLRVALRHNVVRTKDNLQEQEKICIGELCIDFEKRKITIRGEEIHLTPIEFKIIVTLVKQRGKVLTHSYIIKEVWGAGVGSETQSLRVFMANIRRKIEENPAEPRYIFTEVGVGYRLIEE